MKRILTALVYVAALGLALPVFAGFQVVTRDCGPYHYEIQPVMNGTIFRVKDGARTRETFYGSRDIGILTGCQGNTIALEEHFTSKYYGWTDILVINPEGAELRIEKQLTGGNGSNQGSHLPSNRITTIKGVIQLTGQVLMLRTNAVLSYEGIPPRVEISYLKNGGATKLSVPHATSGDLPWPTTTSTMVYSAEYFFDGQDVYAYEQMFERDGNQYDGWMDRWSKLQSNDTYAPTNRPNFIPSETSSIVFEEPLAQILGKTRLANRTDALNDRSYYVFNATGGVTRRFAPSSWNSTIGEGNLQCGNVNYTLYRKGLSGPSTATSTFPEFQYIIERIEGTNRSLISVPHVDQSWKLRLGSDGISWVPADGYLFSTSLESCAGKNVILKAFVAEYKKTLPGAPDLRAEVARAVATQNGLSYVNYRDPQKSVSSSFDQSHNSPLGYHLTARIQRSGDVITGDSTITEIVENGRVARTKPPFFRNIQAYPADTWVEFYRHPKTGQFVVQFAHPDRDYRTSEGTPAWTYEVYVYENGEYQKKPDITYVYQLNPVRPKKALDIYVNKENDYLTLKSFFLNRISLLHNLAGKKFTLDWYRASTLYRNGSQKIWYAFTVDGKQQTWSATIR
jgi:hypothetical protein